MKLYVAIIDWGHFDETKEKSRKALENFVEKLRDMGEEDV